MKSLVLYIHGRGGSASESEQYKPLFSDCEVIGLDYQSCNPWETGTEIFTAVTKLKEQYQDITLIANSIGAVFTMYAGIDRMISRAFFISPVVDMEGLIRNIMAWSNVSEEELREESVISTSFGEELSWDYLRYVREHPIQWDVPTAILYGANDNLTSFETITSFSKKHKAELTVMKDGEHWFHTEEQLRFLDEWIRKCNSYGFKNHDR